MVASIPLNVVISAQDEASGVVGGFGNSLESAKGSILALGAAAAAVFAAVSTEIKDATAAAEEHQNTQAQLAAVIKSTGGASGETVDQINALAESLQKSSGYSADQIEQVDTMLIGMKTLGTDVVPGATQAILDFAARTGQDAVSAAQVLGKALGDPKLALGALTREHIILTQAQQDAIKSFVAVGDTAGAQKAIIDAMNSTVGGAAEQTQTMAFQQRLLNSEMENMQETIGNALLPIFTALLAKMEPIIQAIVSWTQEHPKLTAALLIGAAAISGLIVVLTALAGVVLLVNIVMSPITLIILAIVAAIVLLVAAAYEIETHWSAISAFFKGLWDEIKTIFNEAITAIVAFFQPLVNIVQTIADGISKVASGIGSVAGAVGGAVSGAVHAIIPHAAGGSVIPGQTYLVGENGPELFQSGGSGFITPNHQLAAAGGGVTINITGTFMSRDAAVQMGNKMIDVLKMRTRVGLLCATISVWKAKQSSDTRQPSAHASTAHIRNPKE